MGASTLVDISVADAIELTKKLDALNKPPRLVAWFYYEDADEWRLLLAGTEFEPPISKQEVAYRSVLEAMSGLPLTTLTASDIKLIPIATPVVGAFRTLVRTGPTDTGRVHLTNTTLNGIFIKEAVIIRSA
jgi:hypothetical protein